MRKAHAVGAALLATVVVLAIPLPTPRPDSFIPGSTAFVWNQDSLWNALEGSFSATRSGRCGNQDLLESSLYDLRARIDTLFSRDLGAEDRFYRRLENNMFEAGAYAAACPGFVQQYVGDFFRIREGLKLRSQAWNFDEQTTRETLYRLLYGGRTAVEEVMLQQPDELTALFFGGEQRSRTPSAVVQGVTVHSGDLLVSRGGAPTSALIARGNDFPGNFSHVALAYVDSTTGNVSVVEAHIEGGVAVASAEEYLRDKKLRIMVLRLRADLPQLVSDPMLPHRAASLALQRAESGHTPYDFEMNYQDPEKLFCSEVASSVYGDLGVSLWTGISTISSPGLQSWLASFGVRYFETQEPSDLEYDPQLAVVAEWRDPATLREDRIDNAVIDAMLEGAEAGDQLDFPWYQLPLARAMKAVSWFTNLFGVVGFIPEGMSAAAALKNRAFSARQSLIAREVGVSAVRFEGDNGYAPPYWKLFEMAQDVVASNP